MKFNKKSMLVAAVLAGVCGSASAAKSDTKTFQLSATVDEVLFITQQNGTALAGSPQAMTVNGASKKLELVQQLKVFTNANGHKIKAKLSAADPKLTAAGGLEMPLKVYMDGNELDDSSATEIADAAKAAAGHQVALKFESVAQEAALKAGDYTGNVDIVFETEL